MEERIMMRCFKAGKPVDGCKERAWWQMSPIDHFIVPLLHTLIGIGNDIFDNFRDIVNLEIECLDRKEVETCQSVVKCEEKISEQVAQRDDWDRSEKGKKLRSLQGMIRRRTVALKKLGAVSSPLASGRTIRSSTLDDLLQEIDEFVCDDDADLDDKEMEEPAELLAASAGAGVPNNGIVSIQEKITEYRADITE
jgi:hypothetical protein